MLTQRRLTDRSSIWSGYINQHHLPGSGVSGRAMRSTACTMTPSAPCVPPPHVAGQDDSAVWWRSPSSNVSSDSSGCDAMDCGPWGNSDNGCAATASAAAARPWTGSHDTEAARTGCGWTNGRSERRCAALRRVAGQALAAMGCMDCAAVLVLGQHLHRANRCARCSGALL